MACAHQYSVGWQVPTLVESPAGRIPAILDSRSCFPNLQHCSLICIRTSKRTLRVQALHSGGRIPTRSQWTAGLDSVPYQCAVDLGESEETERHICRTHTKNSSLGSSCSRRHTIQFLGAFLAGVGWAGGADTAAAFPGPSVRREEEPQVFFKTPSGTKVQELLEGRGPVAQAGDTVSFHYVCRRSNGYYVYSTVDDDNMPATLPLGQGQMIQGLEEVLAGMRPGGKRRALIPPSAGYVNQTLEPIPSGFGPQRSLYSHAKEPLVFEVLLLKIK